MVRATIFFGKEVYLLCLALLWKAPEVLRSANYNAGSQQADIYSLAIVIFEIFTRTEPFSHLQLQNTGGVQSVQFLQNSTTKLSNVLLILFLSGYAFYLYILVIVHVELKCSLYRC